MRKNTCYIGIDTSVFVRFLTGHPENDYKRCRRKIEEMLESDPCPEFLVSNQVIGESYIVLQQFYNIPKNETRNSILKLLESGPFYPANGNSVLECLRKSGGCGLVDRLIADGYERDGMKVLTHDRKMAKLSNGLLVIS